MRKNFIAVTIMSLSQAFQPACASEPSLTIPETRAEIHTLPNGLTVIIEEDRGAPVASVQAWCHTGSIHEGEWMGAGLSHILEHMLFKGTETRGAGDIARQIQDHGGYINAYTSFDRTVYWIDVPSAGVPAALDVLCDAMMNSTLPEDEYVKEQEVIRREFAMGFDDPNRQAMLLLLRTMYAESPYQHPVIGYLEVYNKLTRDDVLEYYQRRYPPNNLTFVIVGDVDAGAVLKQIEEFFAGYPRRALEPVYVPAEPSQLGPRAAHEEFPTEITRLYAAWHVPALDDPDAPALEVLAEALGSGRSSLLNRQIRERKNLAHSIGAGVYSMPTQGAFFVSALCDPDKRGEVEEEILAVIADVRENGVAPEIVAKAQRSLLASQLHQLATMRGKASSHGSNWQLTRNLDFGRHFLEAINKVTPEEVREVARKYLLPDRINVASLNPPGTLADAGHGAEAADASPVRRIELDNGLRLLVREDPSLPLVSMTAAFRGGLLAETADNNGITSLLARLLPKGTQTRSAEEIADLIESAGGGVNADSGNNSLSLSVEVLQPDLELGMELMADMLLHPAFPEREIEIERRAQIAGIKAEEDQITVVARNALRENLYGSHPYALRGNGREETVLAITLQDLQAFHKEHAVARNGVLAVFGDVDADEVVRLAEKYFGAMPAGEMALAEPPEVAALQEGVAVTEVRDKQQAVLMVGYKGIGITDPDRPVLELIDEASSQMGSRFFDRIREEMGLAYFVGASQMIGLVPGVFAFYAGTDPERVDEVVAALNEEIAELAEEGLTEEELERAKRRLLGAEAIRNQSNSAFSTSTAVNELVGLGYDHQEKRAAEIEAVTVEDTKRVARKYFQDENAVEVIVRPPRNGPADESEPN